MWLSVEALEKGGKNGDESLEEKVDAYVQLAR